MRATVEGPLLAVRDLRIASRLDAVDRTIASGVALELDSGETLGIVGESGSGKSLTARAIMGVLPTGVYATGEIRYRGRDLLSCSGRELTAIRGTSITMIFQDPFTMLNPLMRCGEQIAGLLRDAGGKRLRRQARREEAVRRLVEVGIDDPAVADAYPFQLSGGMRQRVGIAAALARDPELVIADEPSTALDVTTQKEIFARLKAVQESRGMGLILITHDLRVAFSMCDRVEILYAGSVLERGAAAAMEATPHHPYTLGLLLSEPPSDRRLLELTAIPGSVPDADVAAGRCAFADRCAWSAEPCRAARPPLVEIEPERASACVRLPDIRDEMVRLREIAGVAAPPEGPRAASKPLVAAQELEKVFPGRMVEALREVSLEILPGESVGLVGESGAGKTTLGRCLLGLDQVDAGQILIDGIDATDYRRLSTADRRRLRGTIQMVFQDPYSTLNPMRTIRATLREAILVHEPRASDVRGRVGDLLAKVGLAPSYAARKPVALSGGERQRVAIARALAAEPRVIVCDEPVSALDVSVQAQILNLLNALRRETELSLLFITHDLAVVRQIAERVYVLRKGRLVEQGATTDVLDRPRDAYTKRLVASMPRADEAWLRVPSRGPL